MRKISFFLGCFLFLALIGRADATTTACYTWSCDEISHVCNFDASCSSWTGNLFRYSWDFGDGNTQNTSSATTSHTYSTPYPTVTLTVIPLSTSSDSAACGIVVWNNVGPAQATYGTCQ